MSCSSSTSWAELPEEVLNLIRQKLFKRDYSNFRATCRSWNFRAVFDAAIYKKVDSPFLLGFSRSGCCEAYSPAYNTSYYVSARSELLGAQVHCSNYGWLLLSRGGGGGPMFFYHPSTDETIDLPATGSKLRFRRMGFSAPPTSSECVVFCLEDVLSTKKVNFALIRRGQRSWDLCVGVGNMMRWNNDRADKLVASKNGRTSRVKSDPCQVNMQKFPSVGNFWWPNSNSAPVFHNGAFYCLAQNGRLGVLDLKEKRRNKMWRLLDTRPTSLNFFMDDPRNMPYLVECRGELISIVVDSMGEFVRIFRFYKPTRRWRIVYDLKDQAIFVGVTGCLAVTCDEAHHKGLENTIHFPMLCGSRRHHVFYSMATQQFHSFEPGHPSIDLYNTKLMLNRAWMIPNFQFLSRPQLRWSSKLNKKPKKKNRGDVEADQHHRIIHPHYVIRSLTVLLSSDASGGHKEMKLDDVEKKNHREAQPFLAMSNQQGEEMLVDLAEWPTANHSIKVELAARTRGKKVYSSIYGMLVLMDVEARRCSLLDPVSMNETLLPTWERSFTCLAVVLHSSESDSQFSVMVFGEIERDRELESDEWSGEDEDQREVNKYVVAFAMLWRHGDTEWTIHTHTEKGSEPNEVVAIHQGKIYGFPKKKFNLVSIELGQDRYTTKPIPRVGFPFRNSPNGSGQIRKALVASGSELFLIAKFDAPGRFGVVLDIQAFKLNLEMMGWQKVEDLGDRTFFWGDAGCYQCCATKSGFKKNTIYFLEHEEQNLYAFDFKDRSVSVSHPAVDGSWILDDFIMWYN
ncbi:unnamed protein product [Linum trigynum]|uniref:F-box domain-containing protein n=1 Tax=Linum trigynum TaxID=586398 RepID=A0AAV2G2K2_9ROSI